MAFLSYESIFSAVCWDSSTFRFGSGLVYGQVLCAFYWVSLYDLVCEALGLGRFRLCCFQSN